MFRPAFPTGIKTLDEEAGTGPGQDRGALRHYLGLRPGTRIPARPSKLTRDLLQFPAGRRQARRQVVREVGELLGSGVLQCVTECVQVDRRQCLDRLVLILSGITAAPGMLRRDPLIRAHHPAAAELRQGQILRQLPAAEPVLTNAGAGRQGHRVTLDKTVLTGKRGDQQAVVLHQLDELRLRPRLAREGVDVAFQPDPIGLRPALLLGPLHLAVGVRDTACADQ